MATISAFCGVRYTVAEVQTCVAPPYDVISPAERDSLQRHPYNITHLTLPRDYNQAQALWHQWLSQGILRRESEPCLYLVEQEFDHPFTAQRIRRLALICLMALEEYEKGIVLPHEHTQPRVKEDRLHLLRATQANLEPIHALVEGALFDLLQQVCQQAPVVSSVEWRDGKHQLRIIRQPETIDHLVQHLSPARVWIADGHHRYETCLQYRRERRVGEAAPPTPQPYDWIMVGLTPLEDPGIVILPTHRVLRQATPEQLEALPRLLTRWFNLQPCTLQQIGSHLRLLPPRKGFGVVMQGGKALIATLKPSVSAEQVIGERAGKVVRTLDVTLLQSLVIEPLMGIDAERVAQGEHLLYTRDEHEAIEWVLQGKGMVAFLLNPPTVEEVRAVALAGEKMPPKSTYFYPKLLSGLVMRALAS